MNFSSRYHIFKNIYSSFHSKYWFFEEGRVVAFIFWNCSFMECLWLNIWAATRLVIKFLAHSQPSSNLTKMLSLSLAFSMTEERSQVSLITAPPKESSFVLLCFVFRLNACKVFFSVLKYLSIQIFSGNFLGVAVFSLMWLRCNQV